MTTSASGDKTAAFEQFVNSGSRMDSSELADALAAVAARRGWDHADVVGAVTAAMGPSDAALLDAAATLAARHRALTGCVTDMRSLLALVAARTNLEADLAGGPRRVIDDVELQLLNRTRWRAEAMSSIWQEPMLEAGVAAAALGAKPSNREKARQYRQRSWLLALPSARGYLFPEFQFDPRRNDVHPAVRTVNETLDAAGDPWGVASWWFTLHAGLGARPADLVGGSATSRSESARSQSWEEDVVAAATAAVEPIG